MNEYQSTMRISSHAQKRQAQRAIKSDELQLLMEEGVSFPAADGATRYVMTDDQYVLLTEYHKNELRRLERAKGKAAVVKNDTVITVMHSCKRISCK